MSKRTLEKLSLAARTALTVCVTLVFALLCCLAFTLFANAGEDPTANLALYGEIAFALSMFVCGLVGAKLGGENRFVSGLIPAGAVLVLVIAVSVVFGSTNFVKALLLALFGCFMGAGGALLGAREPKHRRKH